MAADQQLGVNSQERDPQTVLVTVNGEIDAASSGALRAGVKDAISSGYKKVILDMAGVSFMDSAGLRALIDTQKLGENTGATVRIERASDSVSRLLEMTALTDRFMA
ncbi:MAG: STAS domain-containing protein [Acidimicrobiales bacterium]|nr:STAS domain-containing protein [Acidimicrobiales bacterium]